MQLNGSQIFVEVLCEQGVDTLFGYPGGAVLNLYDELYKNSDRITHVLTAHEQGAAHAADGYARATGRTGVVLATSGPGATNLVTGIATAYMDSVPMVAFTGNVTTDGIGRDSFQEAYIEGITMPITKHNFTVRRVEELADTMRSAFRIAQSGRKGPVLVDIPKDVTAAVCEFTPKKPEPIRTVTTFNAEQVKWAADLINAAQRPLVYFGGGVRSAASCQPLRDLLHKAEIPATYTLMAAGVVPYGDPMNIGMVGMHGCYTSNRAVADCDVLIAVGTRFSDRVALNPKTFAKNATIIQIDIDPSELGKNVEVDLSIVGDAAYVLNAMLPQIEEKKHPDWMKMIHEWQAQDYHPVSDPTRLMPHQVIGEVCNQCGPEAVYVTDVGQHQMWAAQYLRHAKSRGFITSGGLGTMGFGYGAAIGAQMALGRDQRVVMFTGDGSFHMNLNEACTAVSYELPIITVIFNNSVLGMVRQWQTIFYEKRYSQTDPHRKTDFVKLAEGFGLKGYRCRNLPEFQAAFADAMNAKKVVVITDNLVEYPLVDFSIPEVYVDYVVAVDQIGNPAGIVSGTTKITRDPVGLKMASYAAKVIEASGLLKDGFSFQTGAGGATLATAKYVKDMMLEKGIQGSFGMGGITGYMVDMLEAGCFKALLDVQCFDLKAVESIRSNPKHMEVSATQYAGVSGKSAGVDSLDVVLLGATQVDLDFNVNVHTDSNGYIMGGSGGHCDTAAGAKLAIIIAPLTRARLPLVVDRCLCISTPGKTVDVVVTQRGIAVNTEGGKNVELKEKLKEAKLPVVEIADLKRMAEEIAGVPKPVQMGDKVVANVIYRDGTLLDVIHSVK